MSERLSMMRRWKTFRVLFATILALSVSHLWGERRMTMAEDLFSLSGPIYVLLYHPYEEGFESAFRGHLSWLKENGYETISIESLVDYLEGREVALPPKPILLTFDDGTLENYTLVYPLLEEFNYSGTAFVITGRSFSQSSGKSWWREVDRKGTLRIESHSQSHSLVWVGPDIFDFNSGDDSNDYFLIKGADLDLGTPIYDYGYELTSDRYFPDKRIASLCVRYVAENGGPDFLKREGWRDELMQLVEDFRNSYREKGTIEKESQKERRLKREIQGSKRTIEQTIRHGKEVHYFGYPWGVYDDKLILELKKYGYRGAFAAGWDGNYPGDDPFQIKRLLITSEMSAGDLEALLTLLSLEIPFPL